jgi:hypothetical protein
MKSDKSFPEFHFFIYVVIFGLFLLDPRYRILATSFYMHHAPCTVFKRIFRRRLNALFVWLDNIACRSSLAHKQLVKPTLFFVMKYVKRK